ncbi:hypothetical protein [Bradyrhizobium sp. ERR14]|uniref:hypothetical protein n=1 Tax=Bradyrhizobium sp. ERR14 TaxID=2663837 RepID=UPI00161B25CC|nr:hypothetical protein [Bradyrhizobium sp. ERR14]MBB4398914.1 hypothetical protein [Bradyrhizobium sp. ERR14]
MNRRALVILLSATITSPAFGWEIHRFEVLPGRTAIVAQLSSVGATLYVGCIKGEATPILKLDKDVGPGRIPVTYRLDDGPIVQRYAMVGHEACYLWIWPLDAGEAVERLRNASRLTVHVLGYLTVDFDLSGPRELPQFRCAPFPV